MLVIFLILLGGYLLGSIPTGVLVTRRYGIDLRQVGSGNVGATNVGRALGKKWAIFVLIGDAAKSAVPMLLVRDLMGQPASAAWIVSGVGLAAVLGHMFSVFLRGRGGKGVATALGAALALAPLPALCCLGVYLLIFLITRLSSLGSLAGILGFPVALYVSGDRKPASLFLAATIAVLVVARHKDNIRRLLKGQELRA